MFGRSSHVLARFKHAHNFESGQSNTARYFWALPPLQFRSLGGTGLLWLLEAWS